MGHYKWLYCSRNYFQRHCMNEDLHTNMGELATTPASSYLFNTDPGCKKLNNDEGQLFHHLVATLLYLSKCTRQDIQTEVAFLCTRVKEPGTDDYKKNSQR